jgi:ABC-2 type transport system permease protein
VTGGIFLVVVAVLVGLRMWFRRRRRPGDHPVSRTESGLVRSDVSLVAAREVRERVRGRAFRVGTLLILVVVGCAIVIPVIHKGKPGPQGVGVIGALPAPLRSAVIAAAATDGSTVRFRVETDIEAGRDDLRSGRVDLVIVDARQVVVDKAIESTDTSATAQLVRNVSKNLGILEAFEAAHLSSGQYSKLTGARALPVTSLQRGTAATSTLVTSVLGLILVFVMLTQYMTWTLVGVMEEKSSRVVEVLLATVRPVQLLAGKVLGIGIVVFAQASLIIAFALLLARAVGSVVLHGTAPLVIASTLVWLVLGYAFYSWVFAAAGSMAERQDEVQSLAFPLSLPLIFGYVFSLTTISGGSASTFFKVLAYFPPTAPFAMPVLVGLRSVTWWEFTASAAVSVLCTAGVARLAAGIYRRAILRTGGRVPLREIFARSAG